MAWKKENSDSQGFSIPWEKIVVQAISSENTRSIYFMIDCLWPTNNQPIEAANQANGTSENGQNNEENGENEEDDNDEFIDCDEDSPITEFWVRKIEP